MKSRKRAVVLSVVVLTILMVGITPVASVYGYETASFDTFVASDESVALSGSNSSNSSATTTETETITPQSDQPSVATTNSTTNGSFVDSFTISSVNVSNVSVGEHFQFETNVTNPNPVQVTQPVELRFRSALVQRKQVTIPAETTKTVTFEGTLRPRILDETNVSQPGWRDFNFLTAEYGQRAWVYVNFSAEELNETLKRLPDESFVVSDLEVSPSDPDADDTISVTALVSNPNDESSVQNVELRVDGDVVAEREISLPANGESHVEFQVTPQSTESGSFFVQVFTRNNGEVTEITYSS